METCGLFFAASCHVAQPGLKLAVFLPWHPENGGYKHTLSCHTGES